MWLYLLTIRPHETRVDRPENNVDPPDGEPSSQKRFEEAERSFEYGHRLLINLEPEFFVCVTARQRLNSSAAAPLCEKKRMLPTRSILHNTKTARRAKVFIKDEHFKTGEAQAATTKRNDRGTHERGPDEASGAFALNPKPRHHCTNTTRTHVHAHTLKRHGPDAPQ